MASGAVVELRGLGRTYARGTSVVHALRSVDLVIGQGEMVSVVGPSGSGKSTLLAIMGCLDRPTTGACLIAGRPVQDLGDFEMSRLRNRTIGFVFQAFHLIPRLTVVENVETPLLYSGIPPDEWRPRALQALERVGLVARGDHVPGELSGGEAQRAAIARALVLEPALILADEPTGNLDRAAADDVALLLSGLHASGRTVVLVTHNETLARRAGRMIVLRDGAIVSEERHATPT
jgi:putative ABC transport system ATP-binding protein